MADTHTKIQRSKNMASIRSVGNKSTEIALVSLLRQNKITGWKRHSKTAAGRPDFIFSKQKTAVFVDGCFWHGCKKHCIMPKSNKGYWGPKIAKNKSRDRAVNRLYRGKGWKIMRIWEHEVRKNSDKIILKLRSILEY